MNLQLNGKNALVCGSSQGIGKAAAIELAQLGANVILVSRTATKMAAIIKQLDRRAPGQDHSFLVADFTDSADLRKKVLGLVNRHPVHILVNNTGGPAAGAIMDADEADFMQAFHNHIICNHLLVGLVTPGMKAAGYGRIINIISTSVKQPIEGLGVSNTIRAAVANWAKTLASELGPYKITVNNVLPGSTDTERLRSLIQDRAQRAGTTTDKIIEQMQNYIPLRRFAEAAEVGAAVAFLASPAASYINGINLPVDGGQTKSL